MNAPSINARAGFLVVLLAAGFTYGLIQLFTLRFATGDVYPEYSSLRSNPSGAKLLYDSLSRTPGIEVARNYLPFDYLDEKQSTILLLGVNDAELGAGSDRYMDNVERLANRGSRVVVSLVSRGERVPFGAAEVEKRWHFQFAVDHGLYFREAPGWHVLSQQGAKVVAMERDFSKGSVVLFANSSVFSNEAVARLDRLALVATALGPNRRVIFDEQHFGIAESGSVVGLARRYRMAGLAAGLALCAVLFIWKNAAGFPPPLETAPVETLGGRTSISGLFTLLRRHVPPADLAATCWNEWMASHRGEVSPERVARAQAILRDHGAKPLEAAREIQNVLHSKGSL